MIIELSNGMPCQVDDEDRDLVIAHRWHAKPTKNGVYAACHKGRTTVQMHRMILGANGVEDVDHINGDRLDNRRANLRLASRSENSANAKKRALTTSKFKGVCFDKSRGKWLAYANKGGRRSYLGRFDTEAEAAKAYNVAATALHGEFARLNEVGFDASRGA